MSMATRLLSTGWMGVWATGVGSPGTWHPGTPFVPGADLSKVRGNFERTAATASMDIILAYQLANTENSPDTAVIFGGSYAYVTTDVLTYAPGWFDVASLVAGRALIRFGWYAKNATGGGSTQNHCRVAASFELVRV